jgi:tetratricopeptide (TPR) repeat protein
MDVFETGHDHRRETFALYELGRAEILLGKLEDGLATLDNVLQVSAEDDAKDFEFIIEIESQMAVVMRQLGRIEEADEVERRLASVKEALN